jgi:hypothetical protein
LFTFFNFATKLFPKNKRDSKQQNDYPTLNGVKCNFRVSILKALDSPVDIEMGYGLYGRDSIPSRDA